MADEKSDERRWPTPLKPVPEDRLEVFRQADLLDPALRHNTKIELVINLHGKVPGTAGGTKKATFGAGCFWHVEEAFRRVPGVVSTQVGFMGGTTRNPTYKEVCTGTTGHAEVVEVTYDPAVVGYDDLLNVFWSSHDPTTPDRQGPDIGTQYRSVIFYHEVAEEAAAIASKEKQGSSGRWGRKIVTQIEPAKDFYRAEEYHQQYFEKTGKRACGI